MHFGQAIMEHGGGTRGNVKKGAAMLRPYVRKDY
jgi:hypothetical protein